MPNAAMIMNPPHPPGSAAGSKYTRTAALKTTLADGKLFDPTAAGKDAISKNRHSAISRNDQWEAWREIQMQYDQMKVLEDNLTAICQTLGLDPDRVINGIDRTLGNDGEVADDGFEM